MCVVTELDVCGVSLALFAGSQFCAHVIIVSDGVIITGVHRLSLARIDRVCLGEPGDEPRES